MANLFYPQLASGTLAQYPIVKTRVFRTVQNILPDGNRLLYSDVKGGSLLWDLNYTELSYADLNALQSHFTSCKGRLHAFTFIDPTANMLAYSTDLTAPIWLKSSGLKLTAGSLDPSGGAGAFTLVNLGQSNAVLSQTVAVPANYQYCFSVFVQSDQPASITLTRTGTASPVKISKAIGSGWKQIVSAGRQNDPGVSFTVAVELSPGQQVQVFAPQLEAQLMPSRYKPTADRNAIYSNAHWAIDSLPVIAEGPDLYSSTFRIETAI